MTAPAIRVENLGKKYRIRHQTQGRGYKALRDVLAAVPQKVWSRLSGNSTPQPGVEDFWALQDVSFDIQQGEAVGIIGRNGAGKSTLLKLLSRITEPTKGRIEIDGRISSLLEVGTGFHPELTGRENVYLNGAILGMSRVEIKARFDEIVAFAEVERFLDTPVKHYSSGMYTRLAFAVAAHLEPDILIVDEVLAVGDMEFQRKCLGKMQSVTEQGGRTVLFVSHNMQAVLQLCQKGIFLDKGRLSGLGSAADCVRMYLSKVTTEGSSLDLDGFRTKKYGDRLKLKRIDYRRPGGELSSSFDRTENIEVVITLQAKEPVRRMDLSFALITGEGNRVFSGVYSDEHEPTEVSPGIITLRFVISGTYFKPEPYFLTIYALDFESAEDCVENVPFPTITDREGDPEREAKRWGVVRLPLAWELLSQQKS
jgi:lipopolysaccharide transport system ATP-binding protein